MQSSPVKSVRGFTLIEVLLATVLLAAGLALAFTTLGAATATVNRGEVIAQRNERMRAVSGFLRRRIASALPVAFATDEDTGQALRFVGEADAMRFVADLPDYLGRGGPHLHDLSIVEDNGALRVQVAFSVVQAGQVVEEREARPPELLANKLRHARFRYRGLNAEGRLEDWQDRWASPEYLPLQVAIDFDSTESGAWPELVIALPQGGSHIGRGDLTQ